MKCFWVRVRTKASRPLTREIATLASSSVWLLSPGANTHFPSCTSRPRVYPDSLKTEVSFYSMHRGRLCIKSSSGGASRAVSLNDWTVPSCETLLVGAYRREWLRYSMFNLVVVWPRAVSPAKTDFNHIFCATFVKMSRDSWCESPARTMRVNALPIAYMGMAVSWGIAQPHSTMTSMPMRRFKALQEGPSSRS